MKSPIKLAKKQNNQHTQPTQPPKQAAMPTMRTQLKKQNPPPQPDGAKKGKKGPKHQQSQPKPIMPTNSSYLRSKTKQATLTGHQKHHTIHQHNPTAIKKTKKQLAHY
ncbi:hypothetical protein N7326_09370 [Corynebacterium sp. ES2794-CONJ1]|uniref:hypothetical protein n=1 Tax=Corynebacterium sp. ES2794-CONJ1 TaxID=2980553 RepID=UPI0021D9527A|nr:hypothetical protein [Corynebacterium sp. ES2794-CONJ1]MCU9520064.1 hypothetical protein [Corynebacterium sp. ES2794-CONJ1]